MFVSLYVPILAKEVIIPYQEDYAGYKKGMCLIISLDNEMEDYARFIAVHENIENKNYFQEKSVIIRIANDEDKDKIAKNRQLEQEYKNTILEAIKELGLIMFFVKTKISLDNKQVLVVFSAEDRIDFRKLVAVLAGTFRKKIQMLQIGARDRSKLLGGYGICGRGLCCANYFKKMPSVTMDSAREQNISFKGPESLSGVCDKLKCCLNYEMDQYKKLKKLFPKFGSIVKIDDKESIVIGMDILNKKIKLKSMHSYNTIDLDEFNSKIITTKNKS